MRIALVEDHGPTALAVITHLGTHQVDVFAEGGAALAALSQPANGYDAVLLDLELPDMRGEEILQQLAARGCSWPAVVLFTTT